MVDAVSSGIMFTIDPIGKKDEVVIEASWGLGESIASGMVMPDRFVCDRKKLQLIDRRINRKMKGVFLRSEDGVPVDIDLEKQMQPALDDRTSGGAGPDRDETGEALRCPSGHRMGGGRGRDHRSSSAGRSPPWRTRRRSGPGPTGTSTGRTSPRRCSIRTWASTSPNTSTGRAPGSWDTAHLDGVPLLRLHKGHIYFNTEVLEEIFTYNPRFSRTKELLNYFPEQDQDRIANAPTKIVARVWAEVRIAVLDRDGTIITNDKAYRRWAKTYMRKMATLRRAGPDEAERPGAAP